VTTLVDMYQQRTTDHSYNSMLPISSMASSTFVRETVVTVCVQSLNTGMTLNE
jgi:hypothetical protein